MKKVTVHRELVVSIILTGDNERDQIALEDYDFDGLSPLYVTKCSMTKMTHEPIIFINDERGIFSHSLGEDNKLSIWKETIKLVDSNEQIREN